MAASSSGAGRWSHGPSAPEREAVGGQHGREPAGHSLSPPALRPYRPLRCLGVTGHRSPGLDVNVCFCGAGGPHVERWCCRGTERWGRMAKEEPREPTGIDICMVVGKKRRVDGRGRDAPNPCQLWGEVRPRLRKRSISACCSASCPSSTAIAAALSTPGDADGRPIEPPPPHKGKACHTNRGFGRI